MASGASFNYCKGADFPNWEEGMWEKIGDESTAYNCFARAGQYRCLDRTR